MLCYFIMLSTNLTKISAGHTEDASYFWIQHYCKLYCIRNYRETMATSKGSSESSVTFEEKETGSMVCKY